MGLPLRHRAVRRWTRLTLPFRYSWETAHTCWCGGSLMGYIVDRGIGECLECGTGVLRRRLTQSSSMRFYESGDYRRSIHGTPVVGQEQFERGRRRGRVIADYLDSHGTPIAGQTVVELGSGAGGVLAAMRERGAVVVYGIDSDKGCQFRAWMNQIPTYGPLELASVFPKQIDIMIMSHLLEHLYQPDLTLMMQPASTVYIETPAWTTGIRAQLPHLFYFRPESFRFLVKRTGWEIVTMTDGIQAMLRR